ncbi:MAG: hypothetical protein ACE5Z5_14795 [Candidatus Bathyarchaeia archaeon]
MVHPPLREDLNGLYDYTIVHNMMFNILPIYDPAERLNIIIDKGLTRRRRKSFNDYVRSKAGWVWKNILGREASIDPNRIRIEHRDSEGDPCLQAVDYLAGAGFQKYERGKEEFYEIIKDKIKYFRRLW